MTDSPWTEHPERFLSRLAAGGFSLEAEGSKPIRAEPFEDGWRLSAPGTLDGFVLRPNDSGSGFVLEAARGGEAAGQTSAPHGMGRDAGLSYLLLADGRLFRIACRGPRDGRFELLGWEMPGAYMIARPEPQGWRIRPAPSCGAIADTEALSILFAAEILAGEGSEDCGEHERTR